MINPPSGAAQVLVEVDELARFAVVDAEERVARGVPSHRRDQIRDAPEAQQPPPPAERSMAPFPSPPIVAAPSCVVLWCMLLLFPSVIIIPHIGQRPMARKPTAMTATIRKITAPIPTATPDQNRDAFAEPGELA